MTTTIGIGVIGFGWMGQAHCRAYRDIPVYFPESGIQPRLVAVADNVPDAGRPRDATTSGSRRARSTGAS